MATQAEPVTDALFQALRSPESDPKVVVHAAIEKVRQLGRRSSMKLFIAALVCVLLATPLHAQTGGSTVPDFEDIVFFADFVSGEGWSVQVAVSNNSPTRSLTGLIVFGRGRDSQDDPEPPPDYDSVPHFTLPPRGTRIFKIEGMGPIIRGGVLIGQLSGFAPFERDTQMLSAVLTYRHSDSGMEVTVPPLTEDDLAPPFFNEEPAFAIFVEESQVVSAGLAVWKEPSTEMCMYLVALDGQVVLNPEGHTTNCYAEKYGDTFSQSARSLQEWFPSWDFSDGFQGRLVVYVKDNTFGRGNDGILIPMALRFSTDPSKPSMSAMPVVPVAMDQFSVNF